MYEILDWLLGAFFLLSIGIGFVLFVLTSIRREKAMHEARLHEIDTHVLEMQMHMQVMSAELLKEAK